MLAVCLMTACNNKEIDPTPSPEPDDIKEQTAALRSNASSVKFLYRGQVDSVWVGVDFAVEHDLYMVVSESHKDAFAYTTSKGSVIYLANSDDLAFFQRDKYLVVEKAVPEDAVNMYALVLYVKGSSDKVIVQLPVRSVADTDGGSGTTQNDADNIRNARAADVLRHPVYFGKDGAEVDNAVVWLNKNAILNGMGKNDEDNPAGVTIPPIISTTKGAVTRKFENQGSSTDKENKSWTHETGIGFKIPLIGAFFSFGHSRKKTTDKSEQHDVEWYRWEVQSVGMSASVDKTLLKAHPEYYISEELNNVLNVNDDKVLKKYPMDAEGTMKMLDDYGVFLSTTGSFGAYCMYQYERQANVSTLDIKTEAKSSFTFFATPPKVDEVPTESALMYFIYMYFGIDVNAWKAEFKRAVSSDESKYRKVVKSNTSSVRFGGNCLTETDITKWSATDNPDNWNLLSFSANGEYYDDASNLVSILDLAEYSEEDLYDKNKRVYWIYQVLMGADGVFMGEDCQYARERLKVPDSNNRTILADVYVVVNYPKDANDETTFVDQPKIMVWKDYDDVEHIYQPLIINRYGGNMTNGYDNHPSMEGYGFLIGYCNSYASRYAPIFDFIAPQSPYYLSEEDDESEEDSGSESNSGDRGRGFKGRTLVVYYALDDWKNCSGIKDILIGNFDTNEGYDSSQNPLDFLYDYTRRGASVYDAYDAGDLEYRSCDDAAIYVEYVPKALQARNYEYVTGIGLVAGCDKRRGCTLDWNLGWPFATTSGTELTLTDRRAYEYYWSPASADSLYISVPVRRPLVKEDKKVHKFKVKDLKEVDGVKCIYHDTDKRMVFDPTKGSERYGDEFRPAFFTHEGADCISDNTQKYLGRDKIYLNYTTKHLEYEYRTPARQAKLFPYSEKK